MAFGVGARVGVYEVTGAIGAGGMGEVYRARDTRLGRDVAIKILPAAFSADPQRTSRFEREARVLAALNHPNIASIHGVETIPGGDAPAQALVLEFVDGSTLAQLIAQGGTPRALGVEDGLRIARQIGAAFEAAHAQGIIHRDLKPANVKVRPDGTVKVLDFGLAKFLSDESDSDILTTSSPTITSPAAMTHAGVLLGTAAYMSPEQARGKPVDKRADIWAFGCVLYEMLSGRRAFEAEDVSLTLAEVMKSDPDWSALPADLPRSVRTVITRCLRKDPRERFHDMGDVRLALDGAFDTPLEAPVASGPRPAAWRRAMPWVLGAIAGSLVAGLVTWRLMPESAAPPVARFAIAMPSEDALIAGGLAVSPVDNGILYVARQGGNPQRLFRRERDHLDATAIPDTDGAASPEFSPDGQWIVFSAGRQLKKVSTAGGPSSIVHRAPEGRSIGNMSWSDKDQIAFAYIGDGDPTLVVPAAGGEARELIALDKDSGELDQRTQHWLPGGDAILFTSWRGTVDTAQIVVQRLSTDERRVLAAGTHPHYALGGYLVFARGSTLWAAPFDADRLELLGEPAPVQEEVLTNVNGITMYDVSRDGSMVYGTGAGALGTGPRTLIWVDRTGRETPISAPAKAYTYARLSPDNTHAALDAREAQNDIWIWSFARETLTRLTVDPLLNRSPVWTPDGTRVAFSAIRDGVEGIYWQAADGSSEPQRINEGTVPASPLAFSPDGTRLLYTTPPSQGPYDLGMLTLGPPPVSANLLGAPYSESNGIISPDGRWLAYESTESGQPQIYIRPFPDIQASRQQVSTEGGTRALWSHDGRELFYYRAPNRIMSVSVEPGARLTLGAPRVAVEGPFAIPANTGRHYDVSRDGQRFLLLRDVSASGAQPHLTFVLNWAEDLKRIFRR